MLFEFLENVVDTKKRICGIIATTNCNNSNRLTLATNADVSNLMYSIFEILIMYFEFASNTLISFFQCNSHNSISGILWI